MNKNIDTSLLRWTFGNHEPLSMYRRTGKFSTGGVEGSALWLPQWYDWFDTEECAKTIHEYGFNIIHTRFFKGMGWEFEKKDFPGVRKLVGNCHKYDIKVLAYVNAGSIYYEAFKSEVPDIERWAQVDELGEKRTYHGGQYWRWLPCITCGDFRSYLKKVIRIALEEGRFDGILFDNCRIQPCYCERCLKRFRDYLANNVLNPEDELGIPCTDYVKMPVPVSGGNIKDPLYQRWMKYRWDEADNFYRELHCFIKSVSSGSIVCGNTSAIRSKIHHHGGLDILNARNWFDIVLSQSANNPGMENGIIKNRIREVKLADALNMPVLTLSDDDGGKDYTAGEIMLNVAESLAFKSIVNERSIMRPFKSHASNEKKKAELLPFFRRVFSFIEANADIFTGTKNFAQVGILYSSISEAFSDTYTNSLLNIEETLLRAHIMFELIPAGEKCPCSLEKFRLLVIPDHACLSDDRIDDIIKHVNRGKRLVYYNEAGVFDEHYRQRDANPFERAGGNNITHLNVDFPRAYPGWHIMVDRFVDKALCETIHRNMKSSFVLDAPETILSNITENSDTYYIHMVNYNVKRAVKNCILKVCRELNCEEIFTSTPEPGAAKERIERAIRKGKDYCAFEIPSFKSYIVAEVRK